MPYKIEMKYVYSWDDAGWTEGLGDDQEMKPMRFETVEDAEAGLAEFFDEVREDVAEGNMDEEKDPEDYRVVEVGSEVLPTARPPIILVFRTIE